MEEKWEKVGGNLSKLGEFERKFVKVGRKCEKIQSGEKMGENL